jgi:hypothetical protein
MSRMADWRQIQARIRKAKNSPDAPAKLNELFQRTRDGMVAWELAAIEEKAEHLEEAGKWYTLAAQRFRRADWRKKAEEALTRLGLEIPAPGTPEPEIPRLTVVSAPVVAEDLAEADEDSADTGADEAEDEIDGNRVVPQIVPSVVPTTAESSDSHGDAASSSAANSEGGPGGRRKRRRGRRGGRGRRRRGEAPGQGLPSQAYAQGAAEPQPSRPPIPSPSYERSIPERSAAVQPAASASERPSRAELPMPQLPSERAAHGRGDPALASRMAHLESLLRRLVQSPLHKLDECDDAPAGPGVFLLSDSDQITSYYVEACQTLRIGAGNLARGGRSGKQGRGGHSYSHESGLKSRLAEYLGINEAKVAQYMKDHCVIRWIQLDDEAPLLAHFAIGVLKTPLNLE